MTDIEMDLMMAHAEVLSLRKAVQDQADLIANQKNHIAALQAAVEDLRKQQSGKCSFGTGVIIKPDGIHELDPCIYEDTEIHRNVTVYVRQCQKCGCIDIAWERQEDTEDIMVGDDHG